MTIDVFDDFLPSKKFEMLSEVIMGPEFPWFFSPGKSFPEENKKDKSIFQFVHPFYKNFGWVSQYGQILEPILQNLQPVAIHRIKANLTTITPSLVKYDYHRDSGDDLYRSKTACFYLNTNNGYTMFNSGDKVESVANRLVVFDSDKLHAGTSCTDASVRVVINFNYFTAIS